MFKKVLVANRGEIACRIIKTLRRLGIQSVAIYSEVDSFHPHVKMADEAYCIGLAKPQETYLNIEKIISIAKLAHVDAIHPGYGFLSENPEFAKTCEKNNVIFIGPHSKAMQLVGSKQAAKAALMHTDVPLIPGYQAKDPSDDMLIAESHKLGFPLVIKATHGGGGKGLKIVHDPRDFQHALDSARREALSYFNNEEVLLEKLITHPRHLEVQILGDEHGQVVHLFERDCSVQRRQQKIIEEAPALNLNPKIRDKLYQYAITVAKTFAYTNAGTVEFLLAPDNTLYFMEMNARLQVEHPITEMITGIDLVEWQIRVANHEKINFQQPETPNGHAIEVRLCAEQPEHDFRPSQGRITQLHLPEGRVDTGIECHQEISGFYDSLLAKEIAWGEDRQASIINIQAMLENTLINGLETNIDYLKMISSDSVWQKGAVPIDFLACHDFKNKSLDLNILLMAASALASFESQHQSPLPKCLFNFSGQHARFSPISFIYNETIYTVLISVQGEKIHIKLDNETKIYVLSSQIQNHYLYLSIEEQTYHLRFSIEKHGFLLHDETKTYRIFRLMQHPTNLEAEANLNVKAPMNATIVALYKKNGEQITQGEPLLVLEAMKMEHTVYAPKNGLIKEIFYQLGQQVQEGSLLLDIQDE
jgi:3-methylcrotonyl-CoA carboxylase alpha subunit